MTKTPKQMMLDCEEFLRELGKGIPSEARIMTGFATDANVQTSADGKKVNSGWWPKPYKIGSTWIDANKNAYVCISSSVQTPNPKTGAMRYWRGEASFSDGMALMVDDISADDVKGKGSKGDLSLEYFYRTLPPTCLVETSPNNYQLWWFFDAPEKSMVRFKAFLSCFVATVLKKGGDATIKDVSRYGRLPIGYNNKRNSDGTLKYPVAGIGDKVEPWRVQLRDATYSRRYSIDEIANAFHVQIIMPVKRELVIDENEYKYDAIWLKLAEKILSLAEVGEGSGGEVVQNMSGKFRIRCPWGDEHSNGDPYGAYFRGPIPGADVEFVFGCAHDGCRKIHKRTWSAFVDKVVIDPIADQLAAINLKYNP